jgi:Fur family ferric uptake transcriptional regulator
VRGTKQASAVVAALASLPGFRSAQEIHAELRRQGETVGLTTVYRHLQVLSEQGAIDTIRDPSGESLYRQCGSTAHHHHLTCRECGRSVEVEGRVVEQWAEKVAAEAGFTSVNHTVELFGLCPDHQLSPGGPPSYSDPGRETRIRSVPPKAVTAADPTRADRRYR